MDRSKSSGFRKKTQRTIIGLEPLGRRVNSAQADILTTTLFKSGYETLI
ncbi:MAG: hypothetical protein HY827_08540 [Actinobacteria bacterium]|nr:hypothetical protein [Actinomycetota bacterium]